MFLLLKFIFAGKSDRELRTEAKSLLIPPPPSLRPLRLIHILLSLHLKKEFFSFPFLNFSATPKLTLYVKPSPSILYQNFPTPQIMSMNCKEVACPFLSGKKAFISYCLHQAQFPSAPLTRTSLKIAGPTLSLSLSLPLFTSFYAVSQ